MSARKNILATIRARQGKAPSPTAAEREAVRAHIAMHPQSPRPRSSWDPVARFREQALILSSTVGEVASPAGVPLAVAHYLVELGIAASAVVASLADWVDLDGNLLLADEPFEGLELGADHRWQLTDEPGLGVRRRSAS